MAHTHKTTEKYHTANGSTTSFDFPFEYYKKADVHVTIDTVAKTEGTHYDINSGGTAVVFKTSPTDYTPANNEVVRIYRDTDVNTSKATFAAGSSIRATDLNNNETQLLFSAQEKEQKIIAGDIKDGAITSAKILDGTIATADLANGAVTAAKIGTNAIDASNLAANSVGASELADDAVDTAAIANNAVTSAKIANGTILADDLANNSVTTDKIYNEAVTAAKIGPSAVTSAKIDSNAIVAAKIATDAVTETKILDSSITVNKIANDAVTIDKLADNSVDSQHYVDGSIDSAHIADNAVIATKIVNNAITNAKLDDDSVDTAELVDDAVTVAKIDNAQLTTLAGMPSGTASVLAGSTTLTSTTEELNLLDGKSVVTTVSGSSTDNQLPSAKAVNDQILSITNALGGFVAIANETVFPNANPDPSDGAGTVVSIGDAGGLAINGSGVATVSNGNVANNATITINGFPSTLNGTTLSAGQGLQVQTTSTLHTYDYHKLIPNEAGVGNIQTAIDDFNNRYQVASSTPSTQADGTALEEGDLWYDQGNDEMKVYDSTLTAFKAISSTGNYSILDLKTAGNTSQNATYPNDDFTLVTKGSTSAVNPNHAAQLIVSINGVIQEPNTGTSRPTNGFALDGSTIKFSNDIPANPSIFIAKIGATVDIGTPSANTVTNTILQNGSVSTDKIQADAINGTRIADNAVDTEHIADDAVDLTKVSNSIAASLSANDAKVTNATHTGEVTGATALTIADDVVDEANLKVSNSPTNGQYLQAQDGVSGGLTWADAGDSDKIEEGNTSVEVVDTGSDGKASFTLDGAERVRMTAGSINFAAGYPFRIGSIVGTNTVGIHIDSTGSGTNRIGTLDGNPLLIQAGNQTGGSDENMAKFIPGGATELYFDNAKKAETVTGGFTITGVCTATSYAGDGSALTGLDSTKAGGAIYENSQTISTTHTLTANTNGMSAGPIAVNSGITLTIPSGATYTVV